MEPVTSKPFGAFQRALASYSAHRVIDNPNDFPCPALPARSSLSVLQTAARGEHRLPPDPPSPTLVSPDRPVEGHLPARTAAGPRADKSGRTRPRPRAGAIAPSRWSGAAGGLPLRRPSHQSARPDQRGFRWKPRRAVAGGRKPVGKGPATVLTFVNPAAPAWAGAATRLPGAGRRGRI